MKSKTYARLKIETAVANRIKKIIEDERFCKFKVNRAMGFSNDRTLSLIMAGHVPAGPSGLAKMEAWLEKWDNAEVDLDSLKPIKYRDNPDAAPSVARAKYKRAYKQYQLSHIKVAKYIGLKNGLSVGMWMRGVKQTNGGDAIGVARQQLIDALVDGLDSGRVPVEVVQRAERFRDKDY